MSALRLVPPARDAFAPFAPPPDAAHAEAPAPSDAPNPVVEASDQIVDALAEIHRQPDEYLHFPWPTLDALVGGIAPGDVWFLAGFSGNGKTSFLMSAVDQWWAAGRRVVYLGLESRPKTLRTHWACRRLDLDPGDALSGELRRRRDPALDALEAELKSQVYDAKLRVRFLGDRAINLAGLRTACEQAAAMRADVVIVDHVDHIEAGDGSHLHAESRKAVNLVLRLAQDLDLRLLVATQLNNDAVRGDRVAIYAPPQPQHVYMGAHKRMIASGMLGLFRPLKLVGLDRAQVKRVRDGTAEPSTILEPNTMGVVCMKHRNYGARDGHRVFLRVRRGRVTERDDPLSPEDRYGL